MTIYLSDSLMLTMDLSECIMRYNDYSMKSIRLSPSCLECDMLNNIYVHDCLKLNKIDIYLRIWSTVFIRIVAGAIIYFEAYFRQKYFVNF